MPVDLYFLASLSHPLYTELLFRSVQTMTNRRTPAKRIKWLQQKVYSIHRKCVYISFTFQIPINPKKGQERLSPKLALIHWCITCILYRLEQCLSLKVFLFGSPPFCSKIQESAYFNSLVIKVFMKVLFLLPKSQFVLKVIWNLCLYRQNNWWLLNDSCSFGLSKFVWQPNRWAGAWMGRKVDM